MSLTYIVLIVLFVLAPIWGGCRASSTNSDENRAKISEKLEKHQAILCWKTWDTGAVIYSAPIPREEAMKVYRFYRDNHEAQRETRLTVPTVIVEETSEFVQATQQQAK